MCSAHYASNVYLEASRIYVSDENIAKDDRINKSRSAMISYLIIYYDGEILIVRENWVEQYILMETDLCWCVQHHHIKT